MLSFVNPQLSVSLSYLVSYSVVEIPNDIVIAAATPGVSHSTQNDDDVTATAAITRQSDSPQNDDNMIPAAIIAVPVAVTLIFVVVFSILICRKFKPLRG